MSIGQLRSVLYAAARFLGDVNAIRRKRIAKRFGWRFTGRLTHRLLRRLWR